MNISENLLTGKKFSEEAAVEIALNSAKNKRNFGELMQCFLSDNYRLAQRAAWCVSIVTDKNKHFIKAYTALLVKQLTQKDIHQAVIRNSLRILSGINIPEKLHGDLMSNCFKLLENIQSPVAIKAYALTVLVNLSKNYPDIIPELKLLIEDKIQHEKPAFIARAKSAFHLWNKMHLDE